MGAVIHRGPDGVARCTSRVATTEGASFDYHDILKSMFRRLVRLPERPRESFFLWGPRHTGKSTLLKQVYPQARRIDLARTEEFVRYGERPTLLREELEEGAGDPVVV